MAEPGATAEPALPGRWWRPLEGEAPQALRGWAFTSVPGEARLALLLEGRQRLLAVVAQAAADHVARLQVEHLFGRLAEGGVDVLLDVAISQRGTLRQPLRERGRRGVELGVRQHAVHHAQRQRLGRADAVGEHVDLLRLRRADQLRQEV